MDQLEQKLAEVQLGVLQLQYTILKSQEHKHLPGQHDQGSHGSGSSGGSGGAAFSGKPMDANRMYVAGTKVGFNEGEYKGMSGKITGEIPRRYRKSDRTYRIQIDGFPKPGGWNGGITATAKTLAKQAVQLE